ncbi:MAG: histone deacetylase [Methanoregulaceae archaeon]|nr:histone deacetylase [Methanoregulaceae archaeon]
MRCEAVTGEIFARHDWPGHPECQERLVSALKGLPRSAGRAEVEAAGTDDLARVHDPLYIREIEARSQTCPPGRCSWLDSDTYVTPDTYEVARYAAGSTMAAVDIALSGSHSFAFVRPPGHHAGVAYGMGFCIFNNIAIAAAYALLSLDRVAIVDWDVHHGNGTQEIFYRSDRVLYTSIHQAHHFPGSGLPQEQGAGEGKGYTVNTPVDAGSGITEYKEAFSDLILPAIAEYDPDLILVSAGQDTLHDDPLGGISLYPGDFGTLTRMVLEVSSGPLVFALEGGYGPSHGQAIRSIFDALGATPPVEGSD